MTAILRLQLDDKDPVRVNSAINQLAEFVDRGGGAGAEARTGLTANTTYYVSTTGSDTNSGTSVGSPFLTIQHAYDFIVNTLDTAGFTVTIQLADGTYTVGLNIVTAWSGGGQLILQGNASTPSNVVINSSGNCITARTLLPATMTIKNLKVSSSAGYGINLLAQGSIVISNVDFGACPSGYQFSAGVSGAFIFAQSYAISGGAFGHILSATGGFIQTSGATVTITGSPAFSGSYAYVTQLGILRVDGMTFSGAATGVRYLVDTNSVINTNGGGANYLPGNSPGSPSTGGLYI